MNRTSNRSQQASNWPIMKWVASKVRSALSWSRKTRVISDPGAKIRESREAGNSPYSQLSGRQINIRSSQQNFNYRKFAQSLTALGISTSGEDGTPRSRDETLAEFHQQLSQKAKQAHILAYKQGSIEELMALTKLRNLLIQHNWAEVLSTLSSVVQPLSPELTPYIEPLQQFQASAPSSHLQAQGGEEGWRLASKHVTLMAGDIVRINQGQRPVTDAIVCPVLPSKKRTTGIQERLAQYNPMLTNKSFMKTTRKLYPEQAVIKETRKLQQIGFNHIIFSCLPEKESPNLDQQLVRTYEEAILAAHRQKKKSVAIPVLSIGLVNSSQRSAVIAALAVKRYLQKCTWDDPPPKIHLVCPATEEGYEIQTILKQHL